LKITDVSYTGSYHATQAFPAERGPEFVFMGRSNVGKSSLINRLVGRRNIARTSNAPGKTRTANFYAVNNEFFFVDVPGYGFAHVSKTERGRWGSVIKDYLANRQSLRGVVHLLDIRHTPSTEDRETALTLRELQKPVCMVFNKVDKIKRGEVDTRIADHLRVLSVDERTAVVAFSADKGLGKSSLWAWIQDLLLL